MEKLYAFNHVLKIKDNYPIYPRKSLFMCLFPFETKKHFFKVTSITVEKFDDKEISLKDILITFTLKIEEKDNLYTDYWVINQTGRKVLTFKFPNMEYAGVSTKKVENKLMFITTKQDIMCLNYTLKAHGIREIELNKNIGFEVPMVTPF